VNDLICVECVCGKPVVFDSEDASKVAGKWFSHCGNKLNPTVSFSQNGRGLNAARAVIEVPDGFVPDHRNRNVHDNRKSNLRIATKTQNTINRRKQVNNKSGFIGVDFYSRNGTWRARLSKKHIGEFDTAAEAARARDSVAKQVYGEWANLNFPN
jgi:hypothetical protein